MEFRSGILGAFFCLSFAACSHVQGKHAVISDDRTLNMTSIKPIGDRKIVKGRSCRTSILIFGEGPHEKPYPTVDEAIADALKPEPGADALANATVEIEDIYTFLYNRGCYFVEGVPVKL